MVASFPGLCTFVACGTKYFVLQAEKVQGLGMGLDLWSINHLSLFMAIDPCLLWFICYILHSDWSLLLLVNTHDGSFHCCY